MNDPDAVEGIELSTSDVNYRGPHGAKPNIGLALLLMITIAPPLRAQGGRVDSPKDPTIVLGLLSVAGVDC